jgi:putative ABC transport system substrate-binding protein
MRRREFIAAIGTAAAWPICASAQQRKLVGFLMNGGANEPALQTELAGFVQALQNLGWVEGKNLKLEIFWNDGSAERSRALAEGLVALSPSAIVCASTTNFISLRNLTQTIPLVFLQVSDPVAQGFVDSLTKPGGNATGFSAYEFAIAGKWLELLNQMSPGLSRVVMMVNPDTSPQSSFFMKAIENAASGFNVRVENAPVRSIEEIRRTIESASDHGGIIVPTDSYTRRRGPQIAEIALQARVPVIAAFAEFIDQGGLMYYGSSSVDVQVEQYRQAASYVDRILKGAKPGDLPIQNAVKYRLYINRRTATALGLEIPTRLLFTAEKVIE